MTLDPLTEAVPLDATSGETCWLTSIDTGRRYRIGPLFRDPDTGGEVELTFDLDAQRDAFLRRWRQNGSMWDRFGALLPPLADELRVSLGEGSTPLLRSRRLAADLGLKSLFFKLESCNPTGSFKDRQVSVAISAGHAWGATQFATVSSGNVGNALSAYCARAGVAAYVWVAEDIAPSKRAQIGAYGAQLFLVPPAKPGEARRFAALFYGMQDFCLTRGIVPMVSARPANPFMVEGAKTIAFEIAAELGAAPDEVYCCVGGGGLLGAMTKGFGELQRLDLARSLPRMHGGQHIDGVHAPIDRLDEEPYRSGDYSIPLDGRWAASAIKDTGGTLAYLDEDQIHEAQALLATHEGVFAEPQGAYAVAALLRAARAGAVDPEATIVCTITGTGLKNVESADRFGRFVSVRKAERVQGLEDAAIPAAGSNGC